jgi:hypothetical protein
MSTRSVRGTIGGMAEMANPAFAGAVVALPLAALGFATTVGTLEQHLFVHVMAGVLWTGFDVVMGLVIGPVVGGLDEGGSTAFFARFTPKSAFLLPTLATVTIFGGITLAIRMDLLPSPDAWLALFTFINLPGALLLIGWQFDAWLDRRWLGVFGLTTLASGAWVATTVGALAWPSATVLAALIIVTLLNLQGFGLILPGEVRAYQEIRSANPDGGLVKQIGQRNAKLAGVQGVLQFSIIVVMVYLRYEGLPYLG